MTEREKHELLAAILDDLSDAIDSGKHQFPYDRSHDDVQLDRRIDGVVKRLHDLSEYHLKVVKEQADKELATAKKLFAATHSGSVTE